MDWEGEQYTTDIRDNILTQKTYVVKYQPSTGDTISLYWDGDSLASLGTFTIVDDITGTLFTMAMDTTDSLKDVSSNPFISDKLRILVDLQNPYVPVELSLFTIETNNSEVLLNWRTESETNNLGFEVQRCTDAINFNNIKFINGNGTSTVPHEYRYTDANLKPGTYYYRLKQVDSDGSFSFSELVQADIAGPKYYVLLSNYPNPFNNETIIKFCVPVANHAVLSIYNYQGQLVNKLVDKHVPAGNFSAHWDGRDNAGNNVASGVYFTS